jgi:hypothetical protein
MRKSWALWLLAVVITLASAFHQRATGPSYPARGAAKVGGVEVKYKLIRTHASGDAEVSVAADAAISGSMAWKRNKTEDPWTYVDMKRRGSELVARLPEQPPAGKLAYRVILRKDGERVTLGGSPVVIRFKGDVPAWILIPHIIAMFAAMLLSARAGLELFRPSPSTSLLWPTFILLTTGGMILGPIVQKYAFGALWTGWPFGTDLTDNKTAIAWLLWAIAAWRKSPWLIALAAIGTFAIYLIPHSMFGSELKY